MKGTSGSWGMAADTVWETPAAEGSPRLPAEKKAEEKRGENSRREAPSGRRKS